MSPAGRMPALRSKLRKFFQVGAEFIAGTGDAVFDGFGSATFDVSDFHVREIFVGGKKQGGAEVVGEARDGLADGFATFGALQLLARRGSVRPEHFAKAATGVFVLG